MNVPAYITLGLLLISNITVHTMQITAIAITPGSVYDSWRFCCSEKMHAQLIYDGPHIANRQDDINVKKIFLSDITMSVDAQHDYKTYRVGDKSFYRINYYPVTEPLPGLVIVISYNKKNSDIIYTFSSVFDNKFKGLELKVIHKHVLDSIAFKTGCIIHPC